MRHTLPRLNGTVTLIAALALLLLLVPGKSTAAAEPAGDGGQLIAQAATQMASYDALQCRVRQRVRLFGQELHGLGTYQQARIGEQLRLRLELKLPIGDQTTHLQQINDGDYLWIRRTGFGEQQLSAVDLRQVRAVEVAEARPGQALVIGGIAQLLTGLGRQFDFTAPRSGKLGQEAVWIIDGSWNAQEQLDEQGSGLSRLPHVPQTVQVVLSRDELLPLFPFRIEYYHQQQDEAGATRRETIMTIEFFEVGMLHNVDARNFTYSAGDQEIEDETELFLQQH